MTILKHEAVIEIYETESGKLPFGEWLKKLDSGIRSIVKARFARLRLGNFGDCFPIVNSYGLWEIRIHNGPGYRIYYGVKRGMILILCAGKKNDQYRDIEKAKRYWQEFVERGISYGSKKKKYDWLNRI